MVTGPASTPVVAVVVAVFVTFVCTGSADGAVLFAEAPAAESPSGTGASRSAPGDRRPADGPRRSGQPRYDAVRSGSRRALSQPANGSAGSAAGGSVPPPLIWAVVALAAVLGFCAAAIGVIDVVDQAFRRGTTTPWAARRSLAAPAPPTSSDALVTRILATHRIFALLRLVPPPKAGRGASPAREVIENELSVFYVDAAQIARLSRAEVGSGISAIRPRLSWCVSHPAGLYFGELIDDALMASDAVRASCCTVGLAFFYGVRLHVEWSPDAELASWRDRFCDDPAADAREASGRPFVLVYDSLRLMRAVDRESGVAWPQRGPSEAVALLRGVGLQIHNLSDAHSTAAREFLCRAITQIRRATRGSPVYPSSTGRHPRAAHAPDDSGGPAPRAFKIRVLKRHRSPCSELGGCSQPSGRGGNDDAAGDEGPPGVATSGSRRAVRRKAAAEEK